MEQILILDCGSQFTQLIARKIREANVFCSIIPYHQLPEIIDNDIKGIIISGSPFSVNDENAPQINIKKIMTLVPLLGLCYGAQYIAQQLGGVVGKSNTREYGRTQLEFKTNHVLFKNITTPSQVWMSHSDTIISLGENIESIANTIDIPIAAFELKNTQYPVYALQFHPEVFHSTDGFKMIRNFLFEVCNLKENWTPNHYITETVVNIKNKVGDAEVIMGLSGGVDSTVAAILIQKAIGNNLKCIFVDNGLLRKNEFEQVLKAYEGMGLQIKGVQAAELFYKSLDNVSDPETKRKAIGKNFIDVFDNESKQYPNAKFLGQGTIYPDVIESVSVHGPSATIKSHHNVGGLPDYMKLSLVEPLRLLFKDEVRRVGKALNIDESILNRHPFPGPGLAIRILGAITPEKITLLQNADDIYINTLKEYGQYDKIWQAGAILLPVQSVGVMGDERTYEFTIALRAVTSVDGMTADFAHIPHEILAEISNRIINKVKGINRVVYDISSKPPATIEWE